MSTTALQLIEDAFTHIKVKTLGVPLNDAYISQAIRTLNKIMDAAAAENMAFGFTEVNASGDEITVYRWAMGYVETSLAMALAHFYGKEIPFGLQQLHGKYEAAVLRMTTQQPDYQYMPETMPIGAGNECRGGTIYDDYAGGTGAFFGNQSSNDLLDGNNSALRDSQGKILEE